MKINKEQIKTIISPTKYDDSKMQSIVDALNLTFDKYQINTNKRVCNFLAQVLHESGAFRFSVEIWGNTDAQKRYDTRVDLGNTPELDGDGFKYRGRGWIQLTGKTNYKLLGQAFGIDAVNQPELIAKEPYDSLSAGWFWNKRSLNILADNDDIITITKKINGGFNGLNARKMWHDKAKRVFPF
jgi:putative chitinase